jgi:hypothetical protein
LKGLTERFSDFSLHWLTQRTKENMVEAPCSRNCSIPTEF